MVQSPAGEVAAGQLHWWNEHQAPLMPLSLTKAIDDGSESTHSGSPSLGLTIETDSPSPLACGSPMSAHGRPYMSPECLATSSTQLRASFDLAAHAPPLEPPSICSAATALPPPPSYHAPSVSAPGLPLAPALPPGVPEPPRAPPRLPFQIVPGEAEPIPLWPKTAPPTAAAPWHVGLQMKEPPQLSACDLQPTAISSTLPGPGLVTTPMCTPTGSLAWSVRLPPPRVLQGLPLGAAPPPLMHMLDAGFAPVGRGSGGSLDNDVAIVSSILAMLVSGPSVPPLPPTSCYGNIFISSMISESLGSAAEAVAAAARDLGDKPVKVVLPWYPTHAGNVMFDHTKPAKVMMP